MEKNRQEIIDFFKREIASETSKPVEEISTTDSFHTLGLNSISAVLLLEKLENFTEKELNPLYFWDHPSIEKFTDHLIASDAK